MCTQPMILDSTLRSSGAMEFRGGAARENRQSGRSVADDGQSIPGLFGRPEPPRRP